MSNLDITAELPHIGIDPVKIPEIDPMKVRNNEEAFVMLLNAMKTSSEAYEKSIIKVEELNSEIKKLEQKNTERKISVIIMTVAEIITAIGMGGIFSEYAQMSSFVLLAGIIMTGLSLYLNYKK